MELFKAVYEVDYNKTAYLIERLGPNISKHGITILMFAAYFVRIRTVELLLNSRANIHAKDEDGNTALHFSIHAKRTDVCQILVNRGSNINEQNNNKLTALMLASITDARVIIRWLATTRGVNFNAQDNDGNTALHLAVKHSNLESVNILLNAGAPIWMPNTESFTPFHLAVTSGNGRILEALLLRFGPEILNFRLPNGLTAIHLAVIFNRPECLSLLIKYRANVNDNNDNMQTPLHFAVAKKNIECVKILVENKADINVKDCNGNTPIHYASKSHSAEHLMILGPVLQLLTNSEPQTTSNKVILLYLMQRGAKLEIENNNGKTAITLCDDESLKTEMINYIIGTNEISILNPIFVTPIPEVNEFIASIFVVPVSETDDNQGHIYLVPIPEQIPGFDVHRDIIEAQNVHFHL